MRTLFELSTPHCYTRKRKQLRQMPTKRLTTTITYFIALLGMLFPGGLAQLVDPSFHPDRYAAVSSSLPFNQDLPREASFEQENGKCPICQYLAGLHWSKRAVTPLEQPTLPCLESPGKYCCFDDDTFSGTQATPRAPPTTTIPFEFV